MLLYHSIPPGLNLVVDTKPHYSLSEAETINIPYNIKISNKDNAIDQKREEIELKPGHHLILRVIPKVVDTNKDFELFDIRTRNCKLPFEIDGLKWIKKYTRVGCELECAMNHALSVCQCLPWYYPNNYTKTKMCEMFGANCFDKIMSDERYYKKCNDTCLADCKGTSYTVLPYKEKIDYQEVCAKPLFGSLVLDWSQSYDVIESFENLTMGKPLYDGGQGMTKLCEHYVQNHISIVTIETPTDTVVKSKRIQRITFNDQLAFIGGTLGLFTGISILSIVEVLCICLKMTKYFCLYGKSKVCNSTSTSSDRKKIQNKEETTIEDCVSGTN